MVDKNLYLERAVVISTEPENCEGDNWSDFINFCGKADQQISKLKASLNTAEQNYMKEMDYSAKLFAENKQLKGEVLKENNDYIMAHNDYIFAKGETDALRKALERVAQIPLTHHSSQFGLISRELLHEITEALKGE